MVARVPASAHDNLEMFNLGTLVGARRDAWGVSGVRVPRSRSVR